MNVLEQGQALIERGAHDAAQAVADAAKASGDAAGHVLHEAIKAGRAGLPAAAIGAILAGPMGAALGGAFGAFGHSPAGRGKGKGLTGGRAGKTIMPFRPVGHPGYGLGGYCGCAVDPKTGETVGEGEAFTFSSRLQLTGAQAINTDLGDFFTTAATSDLVTNNQFPFDFEVDEATLTLGVTYSTAVAATGSELASLLSLKLIERKYNSQEHYQLAIPELGPTAYYNGTLGTPTATAPASAAAIFHVAPEDIYVPWGRRYESTEQWQLVIRTPRAFTLAANTTFDLNLQLRGRRI